MLNIDLEPWHLSFSSENVNLPFFNQFKLVIQAVILIPRGHIIALCSTTKTR